MAEFDDVATRSSNVYLGTNIVGTNILRGSQVVAETSADQVFAQTFDNNGVLAGVLGDNGGSVQTIALLQGGTAVDVGDATLLPADDFDLDGDGDTVEPLPFDATGAPRVNGATVDLGAVEGELVLLQGTPDPDDLDGTDPSETIAALASDDAVEAGGGQDLVDLGLGDDTGDGGAGEDTLSFASLDAPGFVFGGLEFGVFVDLGLQGQAQNTGQGNDTFTNFENLEGSSFDDLLTGDDQANTLSGLDGTDVINGGGGDDLILGGSGFDAVEGGPGADSLFGGTGGNVIEGDIVTYFSATGPLVFDFGATLSEIDPGSSAEVLEDTIGDDIEGLAGASNHSNTFLADELSGVTLFLGGSQADTFEGGSGRDQILGLAGDDVIRGNGDVDGLIGQGGDDDLFGGAGGDVFFFDGVNEGNNTIHDFELGADLIFFTGGNVALADVTFTDTDADGNGVTDALLSYETGGVGASITIIDIDATTVEAEANIIFA